MSHLLTDFSETFLEHFPRFWLSSTLTFIAKKSLCGKYHMSFHKECNNLAFQDGAKLKIRKNSEMLEHNASYRHRSSVL